MRAPRWLLVALAAALLCASAAAEAGAPRKPGFWRTHFTEGGHRQRNFYRVNRDPRFVELKGRLLQSTRALIRDHLRANRPDATIDFEGRTLPVWTIGSSPTSGHYLDGDGRVIRRVRSWENPGQETLTLVAVEEIFEPDLEHIAHTWFHPSFTGLLNELAKQRDRRPLGLEARLRSFRSSVERGRYMDDAAIDRDQGQGAISARIRHRRFERKRGLGAYRTALSVPGEFDFGGTLGALGPDKVWLDVGAGEGRAVLDHLRAGGAANVVAVDRNRPRSRAARHMARRFGPARARLLTGASIEEIAPERIGTVHLISDLFGALAYAPRPDQVLTRYGELLAPGGYLATEGLTMHTTLLDPAGREIPMREWLDQVQGFEVIALRQKSYNTIVLRRTAEPVRVPPLRVISVRDSAPPFRDLRWRR